MTKNTKNNVLAVLIAVFMVFAVMPVTVSAAHNENADGSAQEIVNITVKPDPGESVVPLHDSAVKDHRDPLSFTVEEGYPVTDIVISEWYRYSSEEEEYVLLSDDDPDNELFDFHDPYKCVLEVTIPLSESASDGSAFADDASLKIGNLVFRLTEQETCFGNTHGYFECEGIYPRYISVMGHPVSDGNMNDVLGDDDEGSTVSYEISTNTLTLNDAKLKFDGNELIPDEVSDRNGPEQAMIYAVNSDLILDIEGENGILPAEESVAECMCLYGIYQNSTNGRHYKTVIDGSGELSMDIDGNDYDLPKNLEGMIDKEICAISCHNIRTKGAKLVIDMSNSYAAEGLVSYPGCNIKIAGESEISIHDHNVTLSTAFTQTDYERAFIISGNSKIIAELDAGLSNGICCSDLEVSGSPAFTFRTRHEALCVGGSLTFSDGKWNVLVNTKPTKKGSVPCKWTELVKSPYRYVEVTGS